jgi:outer membrane protein TolC
LPLVLSAAFVVALPLQTALGQSGDMAQLSLDQCLRTALDNNLDLVSAKRDPAIAEQEIDVNRAPFDGAIDAGLGFSQSDSDETIIDNTSGLSGPASSEADMLGDEAGGPAFLSFSNLLNYGGSYSVSFNFDDIDSSATTIQPATGFLTQSDFTQTRDWFSLTYAMPLLNGFGKEVNTIDILLARGNLEISKEDLRLSAMLTVQSVEDAYWDLLAAREALKVSRQALERAEQLLELNKKKVEVGTLAPIEITEAEAGVASQVESVIVAEVLVENAEDVLLQLLAVPDDDPMWEQSLDLTDRPSFAPVDIDLEAAIETALDRRPEMAAAGQTLRDSELSERVAKRRVRHGLDLTAGLTPDQQADTDRLLRTLAPPGIPDSDTTTDSESSNWRIGLRYSYPLHNRAAKANYAIAKLNTEKSDLALRNVEQGIRVDVRRSVRNTESGIQRVEAARKNVELQKQKLEAEQKKFDNGMSTSFEVLTFQNDLADAELAEIRARLDYLKSLTALELSRGTLLEERGLSLGE